VYTLGRIISPRCVIVSAILTGKHGNGRKVVDSNYSQWRPVRSLAASSGRCLPKHSRKITRRRPRNKFSDVGRSVGLSVALSCSFLHWMLSAVRRPIHCACVWRKENTSPIRS